MLTNCEKYPESTNVIELTELELAKACSNARNIPIGSLFRQGRKLSLVRSVHLFSYTMAGLLC
jgi:hypothetical protein